MSSRVIAIIEWGASALLKENARFFRRAGEEGRIRPREGRDGSVKNRSLTLWEDGSCEVQRFTPAAVARRLGGTIVRGTARKVRMGRRE